MTDFKPATFKQGVPKAERNGFYGIEEAIIAQAGERIVAVVTYEVVRVMHEEIEDERYPVLEVIQIEPLRNDTLAASGLELMHTAYKARTGDNALDGV